MFGKRKVATLVAEFLGTGLLTLLVLNVQRSTIGVPFFVAIAAGLALAVSCYLFSNKDGGGFNPAITLAWWTARQVETLQAVMLIAMQFLGAWGAYMLYTYYVSSTLQPVGGKFVATTLVAEAVGTFILTLAMTAVMVRRQNATSAAAFSGLGLTVGIIAASPAAIGLLNPAVALGTRAWVLGTYVLGPVIGALLAVHLYMLLLAGNDTEAKVSVASASTKAPAKKAPAKKKTVAKKKSTRK